MCFQGTIGTWRGMCSLSAIPVTIKRFSLFVLNALIASICKTEPECLTLLSAADLFFPYIVYLYNTIC